MNERPTPETDGIEFHAMAGMMPPYNTVPADFARRLERERDEAREQNAAMREAIRGAHEALDCLTLVVGLTPIAGNKEALQEANNQARAVLTKLQPYLDQ